MRTPTTSSLLHDHCRDVLVLLSLGVAALSPAWAEGGKDCAPLGSLPSYTAEAAPEQYAYASYVFIVVDPVTGRHDVTIAGHYCKQTYDVNKGTEPMSNLEVMSNYEDQLDQLGAKTTFSSASGAHAVLRKDGKETWMNVQTGGDSVDVIVVHQQPLVSTLLPPSGSDYHLLGHMPNYVAGAPDKSHFDQHTFRVHSADGDNDVNVQGVRFDLEYNLKKGAPEASNVDILGNYRAALEKLGATILSTGESSMVARYDDHGQAIWMQIDPDSNNSEITVHVIEEKAFQSSIKPPDASTMKTALDKNGHIALYINFDFDKATLRPDAAPIVAQVVALLKHNPDLKLSVEGNTDNVGGHDYNVKLSKDRATAVIAELAKAGIAADRLRSAGNGPDKPVSDNDSSRGRAKNRRVELVKV